MLKLRNLSIGYTLTKEKSMVLYSSLNLSLKKGELTALLGGNGVGKSTLIKTICGFISPLSGEIIIDGKTLKSMSYSTLSTKLGVVLTDRVLDGGLTVYELVAMGRYPYLGLFASLSTKDNEIILKSLEKLSIIHLKNRYLSQLSDGERQRAMIAKVLAQECSIIILDEPTAYLDAKSRVETIILLRKIAKEEGKCILLSTHDIEITLRYADNLILLSKQDGLTMATTEDMVLGGKINTLFKENGTEGNGVEFDIATGMFKIESKNSSRIITIAGGEVELFWLQNMLLRENYQPVVISDESSADIIIKSANEIVDNINCMRHNSLNKLLTSLINNC